MNESLDQNIALLYNKTFTWEINTSVLCGKLGCWSQSVSFIIKQDRSKIK